MAQRSIADLYYDSPVGTLTGNEIVPLDVPTVASPASSSDYQSEGSKLSKILAWIISNIPAASATLAGLMSSAAYTEVSNLKTVATSGLYSDLTGTPALKTVATSGLYSDLTGTPGIATDTVNGLMSASDKTKLDSYPSSSPTSLPPSGPAGGDLAGTYPNPTIGATVGRSFAVAGHIQPEQVQVPANNLGAIPATETVDFSTYQHNYGTLQSTVNTTLTFTHPGASAFCILQLFAPASGTIPTVTLPGNIIGTVQLPTALGQSTTTVLFWDGTNYCVVSSTPSH